MAIPVTFSDCSAVTGAAINECGDIITVNSFDCTIYNNSERCSLCTCRPYSFISSFGGCSLALSGRCSNKVYVLNSCFEEIGGICLSGGNGNLLSVYPANCGGLVLTYRRAVYLTDEDGSIRSTLATANCDDGEFISAAPINAGMVYAIEADGRQSILIRSACGNSNCTLPSGISIKSFVYGNDGTLYGLFSKGYPYRYLAPVIVNGVLQCPATSCFGTRLCTE